MFVKVKSKRRFRNVEKLAPTPRSHRQYKFPNYGDNKLKFPEYTKSNKGSKRKFLFFFFQILFALGCMAGFAYQSYQVLSFYLSYPTRMETVTTYDTFSLRYPPAITISNANRILKSYWVKVLAQENITETPSMHGYWQMWKVKESLAKVKVKTTGHSFESLVKNCTPASSCSENEITWIWSEDKGNSYVIFANYTGKSKTFIRIDPKDISGNLNLIDFEVGFQPEENVPMGNTTLKLGAKMYIHSSKALVTYGIPDYNFKEIRIDPGQKYFVGITLETYTYLPEPYWTKCIDYDDIYVQNGKRGSLSKLLCLRDFYIDKSMKICGCIPIYPKTSTIPQIMDDVSGSTCDSYEKSDRCWEKLSKNESLDRYGFSLNYCQRDCKKYSYDLLVETQRIDRIFRRGGGDQPDDGGPEPGGPNFGDMDRGSFEDRGRGPPPFFGSEKSKAYVSIKYSSPKVTTITYEPQYKINNVIADVGGFLGLWLGVSALSVPKVILQTIMFYRALRTGTFN